MKKIAKLLGIGILLLCTQAGTAGGNAQEVRKAVEERLNQFNNMAVKYQTQLTVFPSSGMPSSEPGSTLGKRVVFVRGTQIAKREFWYLKGLARYETYITRNFERSFFPLEPGTVEILSFMDNKTEQLIWKLGQPPMGGVKSNQNLPEADVELGLGIRIRNNNNLRIDTKLLQEMEVEFPDADHAVLRWEMTKGTIKASRPNGIIHKWKLDRKLGYAPVSFMIYVYNLEGKQDLTYEMTMSDFRRVDGLMMPFKMEGKAQKWREGKPEMVQMLFVNVKEYRFNDPKNIPARYPISWPKGMIPEKPKKP